MFAQVPAQYAHIKTELYTDFTFKGVLPAQFIIMCATRPLVTSNTAINATRDNRHFAVIDLSNKWAEQNIETNIKLDASIVLVADEETQQLMSVVGTHYFNKYMEMHPENRKKATAALVSKLRGLPYQTLAQKQLEALAVIGQL
jgi:hypothetical protein